MVIITADHETGGLVPSDSGFSFTTEEHTAANVPVFTYGQGAEIFDNKNYENTEISQTIAYFFGVTDFGDQSKFKPLQTK
jgi:alkaline phosphatase